MMTVIPPDSKQKKHFRIAAAVVRPSRLLNTRLASKSQDLLHFSHAHPFIDMPLLQNYMQYTPSFIFSRDLWAEYYLKFQYGTEIIFDTLSLEVKEINFDSEFMIQNYTHFKSLKSSSVDSDYLFELAKLRASLPGDFIDPIDYVSVDTHPRYGTADPKRPRRRLKYKNSKHYSVWVDYLKARRQIFERFTVYDKRVLAERKAYFYKLPNFNVDDFCPSTFQEAIYFFLIFGPPKTGSKNLKKIDLFYRCLLSGFFYERDKLIGAGHLFYERRLITFQHLELYQYTHRFDKYLSPEPLENESTIRFFFRRIGVSVFMFFRKRLQRLQVYYVKAKEASRLKWGRAVNSARTVWGELVDLIRLWMTELSPLFADNERSFVWLFISLKVEVWFLTVYVLVNELNHDSHSTDYTEPQPGDSASFWIDVLTYYFLDLPYDFFEHVWFYVTILIRPFIDLVLLLPFWVLVDRLYAFYVTCLIIYNNWWHTVLTWGNEPGRVKGRWWKVPLIVLKWLLKIVLYITFVVAVIFLIDYRTYIAPIIQPLLPFDAYSDESFVTYILFVFTIGLLFFGSFTIREFVWLELGPGEWLSLWYANLNWMWLYSPYGYMDALGSYFPKWGYPDSWEDFSMLETEGVTVSRDEEAGHLVKEWDHGSNSPKWRIYTFRLANDVPAWGDDHPIIEKFQEHRR